MKRKLIIASALSLACLIQSPVSSAALNNFIFKFGCPTNLDNLSSFISGIGSEQIGAGTVQTMQFSGRVPEGTPLDMSSYKNSNTKYEAETGKVSCQYHSTEGWPIVYVSYDPEQAAHGIVIGQTASKINVKIPVGLAN
jgi:hypothetical protein